MGDSAVVDRPKPVDLTAEEAIPDAVLDAIPQGDKSGEEAGTRCEEAIPDAVLDAIPQGDQSGEEAGTRREEQPTTSGSTEAPLSFLEDKPMESENTTASPTGSEAELDATTLETSREQEEAERSIEEERSRAKERDAMKYRSIRP